jgi:hypothetical protein
MQGHIPLNGIETGGGTLDEELSSLSQTTQPNAAQHPMTTIPMRPETNFIDSS